MVKTLTNVHVKLLVANLLYFSEESIGTLNLPFAQFSKGHLLEVDLRTEKDRKDT